MFPVFKPKTQFYCEGSNIYAYIGTKEGVTRKSKYEVLETRKTKGGFEYHKVGEVKAASVWNNQGLNIADVDVDSRYKGTRFVHASGKSDICDQGLLIREKGKLGYQYKRNSFHLTLTAGTGMATDSRLEKAAGKQSGSSTMSKPHDFKFSPAIFGLEWGWSINYHTNIAWNVLNLGGQYGTDYYRASFTTGLILRTNPLGKNGKFAFYLWPAVGVRLTAADNLEYTVDRYLKKKEYYRNGSSIASRWVDAGSVPEKGKGKLKADDLGLFEWNVKAGITLSEHWALGAQLNDMSLTGLISWYF